MQAEIFAEIGEVLSGKKTLPRVPECGKKFTVFKSMGEDYIYIRNYNNYEGLRSIVPNISIGNCKNYTKMKPKICTPYKHMVKHLNFQEFLKHFKSILKFGTGGCSIFVG